MLYWECLYLAKSAGQFYSYLIFSTAFGIPSLKHLFSWLLDPAASMAALSQAVPPVPSALMVPRPLPSHPFTTLSTLSASVIATSLMATNNTCISTIPKCVLVTLEKAMATHSSTLAGQVPWMEEPGRLQSMGSLGVRHDFTFTFHFHT